MIQSSFTLPCGQTIKNRVCKAAMTERIAKGDNLAHQGHINLYNTWADGDVGILLTGNVQVDRRNIEGPANVVIDQSNYHLQMETLKQWAAAGTKDNTQLWMQISHAGRQTPGEINSTPQAPSDIGLKIPGRNFGKPKPMSEEEILELIDRFVFTATVARDAGFTGVQFHSAHGYLLSEFLSPDINTRTDAWGGSLENRTRIHLEIIKKCREVVGSDFPISIKLNSADFQKGGFSAEESIQVAKMFEQAGVDLLEISGGTYEQPKLIGADNISINPAPGVDRAESELSAFCGFTRTIHMIQDPADLCSREVGVQEEAGLLIKKVRKTIGFHFCAIICRSPVLPYNGIINRAAGFAVPDHGGFPLVGNADGRHVFTVHPGMMHRIFGGQQLGFPDLLWIVFHPAGFWIDLLKFLLCHGAYLSRMIKKD